MKRILIVANDFPYPPTHGAAVDMWNRIQILGKMGYQLELLASVREIPEEESISMVKKYVHRVHIVRRLGGIRALLSLTPFQIVSRMNLKDVPLRGSFDALIMEADYVAPVLQNQAVRDAHRVLRIHNEQVLYFKELAQGAKSWRKKMYFLAESVKFRLHAQKVMAQCDQIWFISEHERLSHLQKHPEDAVKSWFVPTHVNPVDIKPYKSGGSTVLFIGSLTITHNTDSIEWYIAHVHGRLLDIPGYSFQIAGRTGGQDLAGLCKLVAGMPRVTLNKDPISLDNIYAAARVFVNPVIRGAGIKIKVVHALQEGMPVVTTALGIEGTGFEDGVHVLVADTPEEFAAATRRVLLEPDLGRSLVEKAQRFMREKYDMQRNMSRMLANLMSGTLSDDE